MRYERQQNISHSHQRSHANALLLLIFYNHCSLSAINRFIHWRLYLSLSHITPTKTKNMSNNIASVQQAFTPILGNASLPPNEQTNQHLPLLTGDLLPKFILEKTFAISNTLSGAVPATASLQDFVTDDNPLVVAFLSLTERFSHAAALASLQADIKVMGGRLLVITNGTRNEFSHRLRHDGKLDIYHDHHGRIAQQFGLYDRENPLSDWITGVEADIPLPALYVISPAQKIVFHYVDYTLRTVNGDYGDKSFVRNLLTAVYEHSARNPLIAYRKAVS